MVARVSHMESTSKLPTWTLMPRCSTGGSRSSRGKERKLSAQISRYERSWQMLVSIDRHSKPLSESPVKRKSSVTDVSLVPCADSKCPQKLEDRLGRRWT